jgi:hypothetical protein
MMRRELLPWAVAVPVVSAAVLILLTAFVARDRLGDWQYALYAALSLVMISVFLLGQQFGVAVGRPSTRRKPGDHPATGPTPEDLSQLGRDLAAQFDQQFGELQSRERVLADRLAAHQQLLEFPEPIDLCLPNADSQALVDRDRALTELFESETERLYEAIRQNAYSPAGRFDVALVRDDILAFGQQVAAICRPGATGPLAGASIERILRAASRCALRFLVELEKLPLDVQTYDLAEVYGYLQRAVRVYGVYESARPYFPYIKGAMYVTRFALGASPIGLGAWWLASSVGQRGARSVVSKAANRWALDFLYGVVRIIGFEVASVYDADYRFRDPNWVYGAELTELLYRFPGSPSTLRQAMREICALQLRNEYDRVYLIRAVGEGKSVDSERFPISEILSSEQRRKIAERLEAFLEGYLADAASKAVAQWRSGVEERLDVKLSVEPSVSSRPESEQIRESVRALAGYLLEVKQCEPEDLPARLAETALVSRLDENARRAAWSDLRENPPFFFEKPDLQPGGRIAEQFLRDLIRLTVLLPPYHQAADEVIIATAHYLRSDAAKIVRALEEAYIARVAELLSDVSPVRRVPADVARRLLDLMQPDEGLNFLYRGVVVSDGSDTEDGQQPSDAERTWLVGVGKRLVCFRVEDTPVILWQGDDRVELTRVKRYLSDGCQVTGWHLLQSQAGGAPRLLIRGAGLGRYGRRFAPLVAFCSREDAG